MLLGPAEWRCRGRAGEDRVALRVGGFDLGLWNWFSLGLSTVFGFSHRTSPFRRGTQLEEAIFSAFPSTSLLLLSPLVTPSDETSGAADGRTRADGRATADGSLAESSFGRAAPLKLPSPSLSIVITGRQLLVVGGGREEGGGRELALVDGVEREELEAGDECELLGEEWERRRGGGWVEAEGGSELALVDVVERKELVAGVDGEDWGR